MPAITLQIQEDREKSRFSYSKPAASKPERILKDLEGVCLPMWGGSVDGGNDVSDRGRIEEASG